MLGKRLGFAALLAAISSSANTTKAQTLEEEALPIIELEGFVVTGTHFTSGDVVIDLPIARIGGESLDLWNDPSAYNALLDQPFSYGYANSDTQSNASSGSAGANLRGLGNLNTLTLINGRRAGGNSAYGFQHGGFADLNLIPAAAIEEIQVAVDGTSVIYGSDAVAGTVNLLLHDDFVGNRVSARYSNTTEADGAETTLSFLTGHDLNERTHIVLMGSWFERNAIYARDRDISEDADFTDQGGTNQRSATYSGRIGVDGTQYALDGATVPTSILSDYTTTIDGFNFNDFAPAIPELEQGSAMANISFQLAPKVELWSELLYTETEFSNALAPAPWIASGADPLFTSILGSPHLPDLDGGTLTSLRYRNLELGNLEGLHEKKASRFLVGLRGEIGAWDWETAVMNIDTELDTEWSGIVDSSTLIGSIDDGSFNPFADSFSSGLNAGFNFDNTAALQAASTTAGESFDEEYRSFDFKIGGPAFELPAGDLLTLIGSEYREEEVGVDVDSSIQFFAPTALGLTSGYAPYNAERNVFSLFAEAFVPVFGDAEDPDSQSLDLQLAARYEDYSDESGGVKNSYSETVYKVGLDYRPTKTLSLKASIGTAFRAPTLTESYSDGFASFIYDDPTDQTPPFERVGTLIFANPNLEPETSHTLNVGFTYESEQFQGLRASVNYYRIETEDAITNNGQDLVDNEQSLIRDGSGALSLVFANRFNAAEVITDGLEYEIAYLHQTESQQWEASIGVNQVLRYDIKPTDDSAAIDFLGRLVHPLVPSESVQGPGSIPEYKGYARLVWSSGPLTLGGTINYIHSLDDNAAATSDGEPREIDSWTSLDLIAQYAWPAENDSWLGGTTLTLGIENATNEEPPFAAGAFADGYDSSLYSLEGRRISISVSRDF